MGLPGWILNFYYSFCILDIFFSGALRKEDCFGGQKFLFLLGNKGFSFEDYGRPQFKIMALLYATDDNLKCLLPNRLLFLTGKLFSAKVCKKLFWFCNCFSSNFSFIHYLRRNSDLKF